jgi:hypothetical protein
MKEVRVVVFIDGGRVDQVISDCPVEVVIVDNDIDGLDDEDIVEVLGESSYVYGGIESAEVSPSDVLEVFEDVGRHLGNPVGVALDGLCPECSQQRRLATKEEISCARARYQNSDLEIDTDARVSEADDHLWVQAWVYLPRATNGAGE